MTPSLGDTTTLGILRGMVAALSGPLGQLILGALLAALGGFMAQMYQSHCENLADKRRRIMKVITCCVMGADSAKNWRDRIKATSVDAEFVREIKRRSMEIYYRTQEALGDAANFISTKPPSPQEQLMEYRALLYRLSYYYYGNVTVGPLSDEGRKHLDADLDSLYNMGNKLQGTLSIESSALVPFHLL